MKWHLLAFSLASAFSSPIVAKDAPDFRHVGAKEQLIARPDRAYLLMRLKRPAGRGLGGFAPTWLRLPTSSDVDGYEAAVRSKSAGNGGNSLQKVDFPLPDGFFFHFYSMETDKAVVRGAESRTILVEVEPGTYALTGVGVQYCLCMGSVKVEAKSGVLTDLGTFLLGRASEPSAEPELAAVSNLGPTAKMDYFFPAVGIRPATSSDLVPEQASSVARVMAQYRAFGPFVTGGAAFSTFLAPMPGVLEYRRGEVIDVKSGQVLPPR